MVFRGVLKKTVHNDYSTLDLMGKISLSSIIKTSNSEGNISLYNVICESLLIRIFVC